MPQSSVPSIPPNERRTLRSDSPYRAAELYLEGLRAKKVLHAAAVSDQTGLPLAGIGEASEMELLALWGALPISQRERYGASLEEICRKASGAVWNCALEGGRLSVSGIAASAAHETQIERDLSRILQPLHARFAA